MSTYFGLDLHKEYVHGFEWVPGNGKERHFRFPNDCESWDRFIAQHITRDSHVALEVTGNAFQVYDLLIPHAGQVAVANPVEMDRLGSGKHTDRVDAERLAHMLALGTLPTIWVPPSPIRELRNLVVYRDRLVREQTRVQNQAKAVLRRHGYAIQHEHDVQNWLREHQNRISLPELEQVVLSSTIRRLTALHQEIATVEAQLAAEVKGVPEVELLLTITGLGPIAAAVAWVRIGEPTRFRGPKAVVRYAGLDPSVFQSGEADRRGHISKNGAKDLRTILVQAAYQVARHDVGPLGLFFYRKQKQLGTKKAIVALARKLLVVIWKVLLTKEPYRYVKPQRYAAKLKEMARRATQEQLPRPADLERALASVGVSSGIGSGPPT